MGVNRLQSSESKNCEIVPFSWPTKSVRVSGTNSDDERQNENDFNAS